MEAERDETTNPITEEEEDEEPLVLSSYALEALKEFLNEQKQAPFEEEEEAESEQVALVSEDWRLSQFWYDQETAHTVAKEIQRICLETDSSVACIACPTLYAYLKKIDPSISIQLLEFDKRFEQYGSDFTFYDYSRPEDLPPQLKQAYRVVVADPPYLSKECLEKVAQTMEFLKQPGDSRLLLLTGGVQRELAAELLSLHPCNFRPRHSSKLGNEFLLFTNYNPGERLGGWELHK